MLRRLIWPVVAIIIITVACCPLGQRVMLITRDNEVVYSAFVPKGEYVWLLYTHSFNKGLVEDGYELNGDKVILRCSRVRQYGAGIPEPDPGQVFTVHEGYYQIDGFDKEFETQWTFVGRIADHRLRIGESGELIHYDHLAKPGTILGIRADTWSILKQLLWRLSRLGK